MANYEKIIKEYMWEEGKLTAVQQGRRFLDAILLKLFDRVDTDLENNDINEGVLFTDGANDYGVDCSFVDGDILYIIQGKYRTDHSYTNVYNFIERMADFLGLNDGKNLKKNLVDVYSNLHNDDINEIKIYYITNNYIQDEINKYDYNNKCEDFNNEFSALLSKNVSIHIVGYEDYDKIHTGILLELPKEVKNSTTKLYVARYFENRDATSIVAEVALKDLARMVAEHKNYIFFSNIRNYKGLNSINKGIKDTYEKNPKDFWYYNNGITIVCSSYEINKGATAIIIKAPQIVNGCQTATTIYNCWNASSQYDKENIDGTILVKIIQDSKSKRRNNITKYTNSQTAVSGKDFFALDIFHKNLQKNFKDEGYFYEIQSNSAKTLNSNFHGNKKYEHLFDAKFNKYNVLTAKEVTQTYIATILEMPAKAKNIGQFMPGCDLYEKVYNEKTPTDVKFYLLPYGVWYYFKKVFNLPVNYVINKDKWKASLLYIVFTFFKIIDKKYNKKGANLLSEEFIKICDEHISDQNNFEDLVKLTFNVIKDFYGDSTIKKTIGDNLPKFLKSTIENNSEVKEILNDKINSVI